MKYEIKMLSVNPDIIKHGFVHANDWGIDENGVRVTDWYRIKIPQTFRGNYTLFLCYGDICGIFQGMSIQDHDLDSLMDKLSFRSPEWVQWTYDMLVGLRDKGIIDFEIIAWPGMVAE